MKPREWFIHLENNEIWECAENAPKGSVHVIEKSHYDEAMEQKMWAWENYQKMLALRDEALAKISDYDALVKAHDTQITIAKQFQKIFQDIEPTMTMMIEALKKIDDWQGQQECNASVYEISDDEFAVLQFIVHEALGKLKPHA